MLFSKIFGVPCPTNISAPPPNSEMASQNGEWKESRGSSWAFLGSFEEPAFRGTHMMSVRMPVCLDPSWGIPSRLPMDTRVDSRQFSLLPALIPRRRPARRRAAQPFCDCLCHPDYLYMRTYCSGTTIFRPPPESVQSELMEGEVPRHRPNPYFMFCTYFIKIA